MNSGSSEGVSTKLAAKAVATLGPIPSSFTTVIRMLLADHREGFENFSKKSEFEVNRILKVSTVLSLLYHASLTYYPKRLEERDVRPCHLARLFDPLALGVIFALAYLYKRCQRVAPPEEWKRLSPYIHKWVEIGGILGREVPGVTVGIGLLSGSLPLLAIVPYLIHDRKGYQEFRRSQRGIRLLNDPDAERERFTTSSIDIGGAMLLAMAFGPVFAASFTEGLSPPPKAMTAMYSPQFRLFATWARHLETTVEQPRQLKKPEETIRPEVLPVVLGKISDLLATASETKWLDRTREDIGPDKTPLLSTY